MSQDYKGKRLTGEQPIEKVGNWKSSLGKYLVSWESRGMNWGVSDCCIFISGAVEALTGINPMNKVFTIPYDSEETAYKALVKFSGEKDFGKALIKTVEMISTSFGMSEVEDPAYRSDGDICVVYNDNRLVCGVCVGYKVAFVGDRGLTIKECKNKELLKVFRVT